MALKIAINGEKKSIAGRISRPVVFIDGVKKRLTKGLTFINGEKKYLWGTENKIEVFTITNDVFTGTYAGTPIYIDEKRLALDGLVILDISNMSSASTVQSYGWGGFGVLSGFSESNTTYSSGVSSSGVLNEIVYNGGDTGLVRYAFTVNWAGDAGNGARLNNGNYLIIRSDGPYSGFTYRYYLYKNNTQIQDLGNGAYTLAENVGDGILAYKNNQLYKITESGVGNAVFAAQQGTINAVRCFGGYIYVQTKFYLYKLDGSYGVVWSCDLREYLSGSDLTLGTNKFIGIGQDGKCYVLVSGKTGAKTTNFIIKEISLATGEVVNIYPFTHYNENGGVIMDWRVGSYVSNSGYLGLVSKPSASPSNKIVVARIFVG